MVEPFAFVFLLEGVKDFDLEMERQKGKERKMLDPFVSSWEVLAVTWIENLTLQLQTVVNLIRYWGVTVSVSC